MYCRGVTLSVRLNNVLKAAGLSNPRSAAVWVILAANIGKNWPDSPGIIGTFARHSSRLATASLFLFRRRCLVARSVSLATPSPYSLQGMSEKIHFERFICQHPLQLGDLPTQDQLAGSCMGRVYFLESIAPVVKQSSRYPKLSRKPEYVVAELHSLESLASKFVTVSLPFLSLTLRLLSRKVCIIDCLTPEVHSGRSAFVAAIRDPHTFV